MLTLDEILCESLISFNSFLVESLALPRQRIVLSINTVLIFHFLSVYFLFLHLIH